jgi:hypothetical protein
LPHSAAQRPYAFVSVDVCSAARDAVVKAAASAGATDLVERALDDVAAIAGDRNVPSVKDLLLAVRPALFALRRLGALDAARRFLAAFEPITLVSGKETGPLAAALAEGFHQLGEYDLANQLIERALGRASGDASGVAGGRTKGKRSKWTPRLSRSEV